MRAVRGGEKCARGVLYFAVTGGDRKTACFSFDFALSVKKHVSLAFSTFGYVQDRLKLRRFPDRIEALRVEPLPESFPRAPESAEVIEFVRLNLDPVEER